MDIEEQYDKIYQKQRAEKRRIDMENSRENAITREEYEEKKNENKADKQKTSE